MTGGMFSRAFKQDAVGLVTGRGVHAPRKLGGMLGYLPPFCGDGCVLRKLMVRQPCPEMVDAERSKKTSGPCGVSCPG